MNGHQLVAVHDYGCLDCEFPSVVHDLPFATECECGWLSRRKQRRYLALGDHSAHCDEMAEVSA